MQGKNETENAQTCFVTISLRLFLVQVYALCCYNFCFFLVDVEIMVVNLGSGPSEEEEGKFLRPNFSSFSRRSCCSWVAVKHRRLFLGTWQSRTPGVPAVSSSPW